MTTKEYSTGCPASPVIAYASDRLLTREGVIAWERSEQDECERGTPSCCIKHSSSSTRPNTDCETW